MNPGTERAAIDQDVRKALAAEERWPLAARRVALLGVVTVLVGGGPGLPGEEPPRAPARYVTATPSTGDVAEKVQATGAVQPVLQVNIGAQVNGRVARCTSTSTPS
jgi:HlyD family secretion protein